MPLFIIKGMESSGHTGDKAMHTTRNQQISDLFRDHQATVARRVAKQANVSAATIEDACSFAWTQLVARPDVRLDKTWEVLGWLTKTAVREAWQQGRRPATDELDTTGVEGTARGLRAYDDVEQTVIGRDRLRSLAASRDLPGLTDRQRKMLLLHAIGYTYAEISEITGATLRTVDRQIYRAHARAQQIDSEHA